MATPWTRMVARLGIPNKGMDMQHLNITYGGNSIKMGGVLSVWLL